mmetsp:Transcript_42868/g.135268  ORF Transcript_42868/g.135268 Transcript_42868/m.135268 type:complete len:450 (-) Transcript_42868:57-1406(-)
MQHRRAQPHRPFHRFVACGEGVLRRVEEQRGVAFPVGQRRVDTQHEQHVVEDVHARRSDHRLELHRAPRARLLQLDQEAEPDASADVEADDGARDEDDEALFRVDARDASQPRGDPAHQRVQQRVHGVVAVGVQRRRRLSVAGELHLNLGHGEDDAQGLHNREDNDGPVNKRHHPAPKGRALVREVLPDQVSRLRSAVHAQVAGVPRHPLPVPAAAARRAERVPGELCIPRAQRGAASSAEQPARVRGGAAGAHAQGARGDGPKDEAEGAAESAAEQRADGGLGVVEHPEPAEAVAQAERVAAPKEQSRGAADHASQVCEVRRGEARKEAREEAGGGAEVHPRQREGGEEEERAHRGAEPLPRPPRGARLLRVSRVPKGDEAPVPHRRRRGHAAALASSRHARPPAGAAAAAARAAALPSPPALPGGGVDRLGRPCHFGEPVRTHSPWR